MFCAKCGQKIEPAAKFCPACGTPAEALPETKFGRQNLSPSDYSFSASSSERKPKNSIVLTPEPEKKASESPFFKPAGALHGTNPVIHREKAAADWTANTMSDRVNTSGYSAGTPIYSAGAPEHSASAPEYSASAPVYPEPHREAPEYAAPKKKKGPGLWIAIGAVGCVVIALLVIIGLRTGFSFGFLNFRGGSSGTSSSETGKNPIGVPEQYLKMDIEDFIYEYEFEAGYTFNASHAYDEASAVDSVTITLNFAYEFGIDTYIGTCNYKYDSGADNWSRIGNVRWDEGIVKLNETVYETTHSGETYGLQWTIDIIDLDLQNDTITCNIDLIDSNEKVYHADGFNTYPINEGQGGCSFRFNAWGEPYWVSLSESGISVFYDW